MRPYQGGDLINLYQEYPHALEMAKKGSFAIYPLFKYTKDSTLNKPLILLVSLIIQEKLLLVCSKETRVWSRTNRKTEEKSWNSTSLWLVYKEGTGGRKNQLVEGIVPIGLDIDSEEVVTVDFKKVRFTRSISIYMTT